MTGSASHSRTDVVRGYMVLPHAVPIIVVMSATTAFGLVAAHGWPGTAPILALLGAMFGGQLAVGAVNELADAELDAISRPEKPIPAGLVSQRGATLMVVLGLVLMCLCSLRFSLPAFGLCALGTGTGIAYSLVFKRTIWSWVPYLIALPLLPIWVWTALDRVDAGLFAIYPIGFAAVIAVQLAQSIPDITGDREANVRTLAVALGQDRARRACWGSMIGAAILVSILAPWLTHRPMFAWIAAALALALVGLAILVWRGNPQQGDKALFPCIAPAAAVLGIGWALALVGG